MRGSVRKKGNNWYYTMETARINGKRHRIERYGGKTKGEAQVKLRQAIKDAKLLKIMKMPATFLSLLTYL
ncbi:Arm DNA-binding domain-containing protein [Vagococcus salmoninarum]|uniref:Arm DNA-binding domain-containing protein n=1 Tax=Vagococcus salmoninarum TaxID=2739 RepID=UPI003F97C728